MQALQTSNTSALQGVWAPVDPKAFSCSAHVRISDLQKNVYSFASCYLMFSKKKTLQGGHCLNVSILGWYWVRWGDREMGVWLCGSFKLRQRGRSDTRGREGISFLYSPSVWSFKVTGKSPLHNQTHSLMQQRRQGGFSAKAACMHNENL